MSHLRKTWLTSGVLVLGCLILSGVHLHAGDKEKGEPKKAGPLLSKSAELSPDDEKDTKRINSPCKLYRIKLDEGKAYQIDLKSREFDAYLRLLDPTGKEVAFDDDGGGFPDARIVYKAPKAGDYKVVVTSFDGKSGKFDLTVVEGGSVSGAGASIFKSEAKELKLKDGKVRFEGELDADTPTVKNHYYRLFTVKLEAGRTYRIDHMSDDFDCFLFLENPQGKTLAQDDDGGDGLNSRIVFKAQETGDYRVIATSLKAKEKGKFVLEIKAASPAEEKEIALLERVTALEDGKSADRKKLIQEVTAHLKSKGAKLSLNDARIASQLTLALEGTDLAPEMFKTVVKVFASADNPQVATVAKAFEKIGKEFPISGKTLDGKDFDLKKLKGKVVLVDFWATWCGPCIAEIPNMIDLHKKYHKRGFEVIGVSLDRTDDALMKGHETYKLPWPSINVEDSRKLADLYDVDSIPFPVLLDANGRVVSFRARGPQLERLLERLLAEKK